MSVEKLKSPIVEEQLPKDTIHVRLESLQEELKKNPKNPEIRSQIAALRRELNRAKRFTEIKNAESEKLIWGKWFDSVNANELLKIDRFEWKRWEFLSKTFLYKQTQDAEGVIYEEFTDARDVKEGDTILVDFWKNESANRRIGLWHMLPSTLEYVKVNGKIGMRSIINNRTGYYEWPKTADYIPVFTGDLVTIPTKAEIESFEVKIKNTGLMKNTDERQNNEANDAYIELLDNTHMEAVEINTATRESYDFWKSKWLPHHVASAIVANEFHESSFNPRARGDGWKAMGLFQWHKPRRDIIFSNTGVNIETANRDDQLKAAYWEMTNGEYGKIFERLKSSKTASEAAKIFAEDYERCAQEKVNQRLISAESYAVLLDPDNRSYNLWDHVVQRWPAQTGKDSCGAAVRELLKSYGISGLSESGAHGKTWNETLDRIPDKFVRIKISHPREAYPGAILVYDGGTRGSDANQDFGHVEIKWSDGRYYSYYASESAAGSAKSKELNPDKYREETGFTGYAYYPRKRV
jgi:hypothetical protein